MGHGRYKNLWPMRQPGFLNREREIFKCTECGAETAPAAGHDGEPDVHRCRPGCRCRSKLTVVRPADFGENFARVRFDGMDVPTGPGENPVAAAREKYAEGWERVFGGRGVARRPPGGDAPGGRDIRPGGAFGNKAELGLGAPGAAGGSGGGCR